MDRLPIHKRWTVIFMWQNLKCSICVIHHDAVNIYGGVEYSASILDVSYRSLTAKVVVNTRKSKFEFVMGQVALGHVYSHYFILPLITRLSLHPCSLSYHRRYSMLAIYSASVWRTVIFYKMRYSVEVSCKTHALAYLISITTGKDSRWIQRSLWTQCRKEKYLTVFGNSDI